MKSPCLGICSTVYGDDVCKGCKRFYHEVIAWNAWGDEQKLIVYERLQQQMAQVMQAKLTVIDPERLEGLLRQQGVPYQHFSSVYWWLYLLWVKKPGVMVDWADLGVVVNDSFAGLAPAQLINQVDDEVNALAQQAQAMQSEVG
jgi:uncharacterized protein